MTKITHKLPLQSLHTKLQNDIQCERPTQIGSKRLKTGVFIYYFFLRCQTRGKSLGIN